MGVAHASARPDPQFQVLGVSAHAAVDQASAEHAIARPAPPAPEAEAYLMEALRLLRENHINAADADWPAIIRGARSEIGGAASATDTYSAIRNAIRTLGERHSFLRPPASRPGAQGNANGSAANGSGPGRSPSSDLVDGNIAVLRLPELDTFGPEGENAGSAYASTLRGLIERLDERPLCGWIVDLRENGGGNMWPMLRGLDPLLGAAPFGYFVSRAGGTQPWVRMNGYVFPSQTDPGPAPPAYQIAHGEAPVAVLVGPRTASSGEMVAIALRGRQRSRSFGSSTAGYATANRVHPLSDGAYLVITELFVRDRTGQNYLGPFLPDVSTEPEDALAAARQWLEGQCPQRTDTSLSDAAPAAGRN